LTLFNRAYNIQSEQEKTAQSVRIETRTAQVKSMYEQGAKIQKKAACLELKIA